MATMLPGYVINTYKRYKSDTSRFAKWLEDTAQACGIDLPPVENGTQADSSSKQSQKKTSKQQNRNPAETSPVYRVPLSRWPVLAKYIVNNGKHVKIPDEIAALGLRAIALRKRCSSWFSSKNLPAQNESNEAHLHFISVLEDVLKVLGVDITTVKAADGGTKIHQETNASAFNDLGSRFSVLNLETAEDEDTTDVKMKQQRLAPEAKQVPVYEAFDDKAMDQEKYSLQEAMFAVYCLLQDLQNIRNFVMQTWVEYRDNKIDVMTAAVTTNTAIEIARHSAEEFSEQNPSLIRVLTQNGERNIIGTVFSVVATLRAKPFHQAPDDPYHWDNADIAEFCYMKSSVLLEIFMAIAKPGTLPIYNKSFHRSYCPKHDRSKMDEKAKFEEDKILLMSVLPNFALMSYQQIQMPAEDELTKGLKTMLNTREIPMWVAFAAQVYLDIHHTLRYGVQKGWQDAQLHALRIKKSLTRYSELTKDMDKNPTKTLNNDVFVNRILIDIEQFFDKDIFNVSAKEYFVEFKFQMWHPLLAGLLAFNLNLRMKEFGVSIVNSWGTVLYPAFLYNAIQLEGLVKLHWPDMERLIEFHGEERMFVGGKPKTFEEAYTKLLLVFGVSAQAIVASKAGRKDPYRRIASNKGPRGLGDSTTVAAIFRNRYCRHGSTDYSFKNMSRVLNDLVNSEAKDSKSVERAERLGSKRMQKQFQKTGKLTPLSLLAALRERLAEEEPRLLFNYTNMHFLVMDLLRAIRTELHDELVQELGPNYIEDEERLATLVICIFEVANGARNAFKQMGLPNKVASEVRPGSIMTLRSGEILKKLLEKNGSGQMQCKELQVFCKNKAWIKEEKPKPERNELLYWIRAEDILDPIALERLCLGL